MKSVLIHCSFLQINLGILNPLMLVGIFYIYTKGLYNLKVSQNIYLSREANIENTFEKYRDKGMGLS